mmetsp:Transcript_20643/g.37180  ORF Transcript_20643/g.37180 Transcript_20643/m.37180 type:complete len:202 (+) Transcript_20643:254-859(+)
MRDVSVIPLISKLLSIDGLTTCAIATSEVATLAHEARNNAVPDAAFEVERLARLALALLASAQRSEVLCSLGILRSEKLHLDLFRFLVADLDVKVNGHVPWLFSNCFEFELHRTTAAAASPRHENHHPNLEEPVDDHDGYDWVLHQHLLDIFNASRLWRYLDHFNLKDKGRVARDRTSATSLSVAKRSWQPEFVLVSISHH